MRVSCFNIRDTLIIMNIFIANYQNRKIGKSEWVRKDWDIYEYSYYKSVRFAFYRLYHRTRKILCKTRSFLGERTNVTFLRKISTSTCKLQKNFTESACLSERSKQNAVDREYSMCEKAMQRWFSGKKSWQVLIQIVISQAIFQSFERLPGHYHVPASCRDSVTKKSIRLKISLSIGTCKIMFNVSYNI